LHNNDLEKSKTPIRGDVDNQSFDDNNLGRPDFYKQKADREMKAF